MHHCTTDNVMKKFHASNKLLYKDYDRVGKKSIYNYAFG
jgi:hypothetical protein